MHVPMPSRAPSPTLTLLSLLVTTARGLVVLPDGRQCRILTDEHAVATHILSRVAALANEAIADKGAFSISIGSGTTVAPLAQLAGALDFDRVHVFFGNERTEGESAGKCFDGAADFVSVCGIPESNVHRVPAGEASSSAALYEATLRGAPDNVVGVCSRTGLPALDLVLLGSGADGHTASLYPDSAQVVDAAADQACVAAEGKGGVTLTLHAINSARNVLLSAAKPAQSDMVRKALGWSNAATNVKLPAAMVQAAADGSTRVEWVLTEASAVELPAL